MQQLATRIGTENMWNFTSGLSRRFGHCFERQVLVLQQFGIEVLGGADAPNEPLACPVFRRQASLNSLGDILFGHPAARHLAFLVDFGSWRNTVIRSEDHHDVAHAYLRFEVLEEDA